MFAVFIFVDVDYLFELLGFSLTALRGILQLAATRGIIRLRRSCPPAWHTGPGSCALRQAQFPDWLCSKSMLQQGFVPGASR